MLVAVATILYGLAALSATVSLWSRRWPCTAGRILDLRVRRDESGESPAIVYEYSVRGRSYRSSLIRASGDLSWSSSVPGFSSAVPTLEEIANRGDPTVYYCPWFPRLACLRPGGFATFGFLVAVATIVLLVKVRFA